MAFTSAGTKDIEIVDAYPCEARFTKDDPGVCDIALEVKTDSGEDGVWTSEISDRYGVGKVADKTQTQLTVASLMSIGWCAGKDPDVVCERLQAAAQSQNYDAIFAALKPLIGVRTQGTVKRREHNGEEFFDLKYLGPPPDWRPKRLGGGVKPAATPQESGDQDAELFE